MTDSTTNNPMLEFRMDEKRESKATRLPLILAVSLVLLSIVVVGVVAALIWKFAALANGLDNLTVTCEEGDVVKMYPGKFLTPEQLIELKDIYLRVSDTPAYTFRTENCNITCDNPLGPQRKRRGAASTDFIEYVQKTYKYTEKSRTKRQGDGQDGEPPLNHGCCTSSRKFSAPDTATTVNGDTVDLVQLDGYKQYFAEETCVTIPSCSICTCAQPTPFVSEAVVYKNKDAKKEKDKYEQVYITFPGCCKCLNILQT